MDKLEYIPRDLVSIYVGVKKYIVEVIGTENENEALLYQIKFTNGEIKYTDKDNIVPIPITPYILEKNGWKFLKHHERNSYDDVSWSSYHKPAETNISLIFYPEEKAFFLFLYAEEISETPIRYIHQLQHLLFGLGINHEMEV